MEISKFQNKNQSGFIVLLIMLILVLGAAAVFGTISSLREEEMKIEIQNENIRELNRIKDKMLAFAVLQPEIFYTEVSSGVADFSNIPGPGYFPCPDTDGDGLPNDGYDKDGTLITGNLCGSTSTFVTGKIPVKSSDNRFTFIDNPRNANRFWFSVDSRYVTHNQIVSHRYLPLNADSPSIANLTLDGRTDIVMVLFYAGIPLGSQNQTTQNQSDFLDVGNAPVGDPLLDQSFFTRNGTPDIFNDYVIAITREEWRAAVLSRVSKDTNPNNSVSDLCAAINPTDTHWFNGCSFIDTSPSFIGNDTETDSLLTCTVSAGANNLNGQNWLEFFNCP